MTSTDASLTGIDTDILVRHLVHDDAEQSRHAEEVISHLTPENPGFVTHVSLAKLSWTLARAHKMPEATRLAAVRALTEVDEIEFEDGEGVVRALTLAEEGADFADALIATTMEQFGVAETVTFDRAAARRLGRRLLA